MSGIRGILLLAPALLTLISCATLPEYAAPKAKVVDISSVDRSDVISYRTLERADFKAERPPPEIAPFAGKIGAATCAHIFVAPDTQLLFKPAAASAGEVSYRVTTRHLRFQTQMDRHCSWWNPRDVGLPNAYVLEHEQIHFALFELEARRLNDDIHAIESRLEATGPSPEEAARILKTQLRAEIEKRVDRILARSRKFDEDTSMGHNPGRQKRWWRLVQAELGSTSD